MVLARGRGVRLRAARCDRPARRIAAGEALRPGPCDLHDDIARRPALHPLPAAGDRTWDDLGHDPHPVKAVHTVRDPDFGELMRAAVIPAFAGRPDGDGDADTELLALYRAKDWTAFFALAVKAKKTIAATGSTGSGKTSLLRRLMQEIPAEERLVTIEDTAEFGPLPLRNRVSLFYGSANVSAENAAEASLRMRPDRVAMQELRGAEAFAYLRLLAAGHPGGLTTWHAEEGDPFTPLALMAKTSAAGRNIPDDKLLVILRSLIDIVAFCRRDGRGFSVPSVYYRAADGAQ